MNVLKQIPDWIIVQVTSQYHATGLTPVLFVQHARQLGIVKVPALAQQTCEGRKRGLKS